MHEQGSDDWRRARAGKITASRAECLLADRGGTTYKSGQRAGQPRDPAAAWANYAAEIVAEILTGEPLESARGRALDWGHDVEAAARAAYEAETGALVELSGFVMHRDLPYIGCSPDGLVGADGMTQIKCPASSIVHVQTLAKGMPRDHMPQLQFEMLVTGRAWSDFVSYDPRMPEPQRLYRQRVMRDENRIVELKALAREMWAEVQVMLAAIRNASEARTATAP